MLTLSSYMKLKVLLRLTGNVILMGTCSMVDAHQANSCSHIPANSPHSPRSPTLSLIIAATLATLSNDRTSRCAVIRLPEHAFFSSSSPFSVKQEAITLKPFLSRWRARRFPKPESQPVMYTYLLPLSGTLGSSLTQRYK